MRLEVILNGTAGSLLGRDIGDVVAQVERSLRAAGHEVVCSAVVGTALPQAVKRAVGNGVEAVIVGGGDGTIATAAHLLAGTKCILGILPLGTMNLLARDLGMPFDLAEALDALADGVVDTIDAAEVNGRPFLNNSVIGLYPRMVEEREQQRGSRSIGKWPAMVLAGVKSLWRYRSMRVALDLGHGPVVVRTPVLAVANNMYEEGFGPILRRSSLTDGVLAVYVARHAGRGGLLRLLAGFLSGGWQRDRDLEVHIVRECTVWSGRRRLRVASDGEVERIETPLHYRIRPHALRILRPAVRVAGAGEAGTRNTA